MYMMVNKKQPIQAPIQFSHWLREDIKFLEHLVAHGDPEDGSRDFLRKYPDVFGKYNLKQIYNRFSRIRVSMGLPRKGRKSLLQSTVARVANNENSIAVPPESIVAPTNSIVAPTNSIVGPTNNVGSEFNTTTGNLPMNLMHLNHMWMNNDSQEYITIQLNLPSGINLQEIDRVVNVKVADDGMSVVIVIEWPSVLTDSNVIRGGWERTQSNLKEEMKHRMLNTIDSNIRLLKQKRHIISNGSIKGECKISLQKECKREVLDMCLHHEEKYGGLVLYVTTKVRKRSHQATCQKIQITSIPSGPIEPDAAGINPPQTVPTHPYYNPPNRHTWINTPNGPVAVPIPPYHVPDYFHHNHQPWTSGMIEHHALPIPPINVPAGSSSNPSNHHPSQNTAIETVAKTIPPCNVPATSLVSSVPKTQTIPVSNRKQKDVPNNNNSLQHHKPPAVTIVPCTTGTATYADRNDVTKSTSAGMVTNGTRTQHSISPNPDLMTNTPNENFAKVIPQCNVPTASSTHDDAVTDPGSFVPQMTDCSAQDTCSFSSDSLVNKSEVVQLLNNTQKDDNSMPPAAPIIYLTTGTTTDANQNELVVKKSEVMSLVMPIVLPSQKDAPNNNPEPPAANPLTTMTTIDTNQNELVKKSEVVPLSDKTHKDVPNDDSLPLAANIVPVATSAATDAEQNKFNDNITTNITTKNDASVQDT